MADDAKAVLSAPGDTVIRLWDGDATPTRTIQGVGPEQGLEMGRVG